MMIQQLKRYGERRKEVVENDEVEDDEDEEDDQMKIQEEKVDMGQQKMDEIE